MSLIVISGVDGTGKTTQVNLLQNYLAHNMEYDKDFTTIKFPRYDYPSSLLVRTYLNGELGSDPDNIDPFLVGSFYAIDRALSFKTEKWGQLYRDDKIVIADRYYESNIIHQVAKQIKGKINDNQFIRKQITEYIKFISTMENGYYMLPAPDITFFLIMDKSLNWNLLQHRIESTNGDIHEKNRDYFDRCHAVINNMIGLYNPYNTVYIHTCNKDNTIKSPEDIHIEILTILKNRKLI